MYEDHVYGTALHGIESAADPRFQRLVELNPWMKEDCVVVGNQLIVFPQGQAIHGLEEVGVSVGPFHPPQGLLIPARVLAGILFVVVVAGALIVLRFH